MNPEERIKELVKILEKANYDYYVLANPTITDQEFDKYLKENNIHLYTYDEV